MFYSSRILNFGLLATLILLLLLAFVNRTVYAQSIFTVANTKDSGAGSLRQAILNANASAGNDTIAFDISGAGPHTIQPLSELPTVTDPVVIDGYTQPGATPNTNPPGLGNNAVLKIELDGSNAAARGIVITAANSTVQGLVINRFSSGVVITSVIATRNLVQGNFLGTDVTGTVDLGKQRDGVVLTSGASGNTIGGTTPEACNIISGNDISGIFIQSAGTTGNLIQGNFIGTDVTGTNALSSNQGVVITSAATGNIIGGRAPGTRNIISGNDFSGVNIFSPANTVQGNFIGTDVTGTKKLGNGGGVLLQGSASNNIVGGTTPEACNIISGQNADGVFIGAGAGVTGNLIQGNFIGTDVTGTADLGNTRHGVNILASNNTIGGATSGAGNITPANAGDGLQFFGTGSTGNLVQGNFIGTDVTGTIALGNSGDSGVGFFQNASNNTIGGTTAGARNVISANNGAGVGFFGNGVTGNVVQGNYIGTDVSGTTALGNSASGVSIASSASNNTIGGTANGAGNTIAFNASDGVDVVSGTGNAILSNSIFSNTGLGIELGANGVTPNDAGDGDTGANNLQNFPEIKLVGINADGDLLIEYSLDSDPINSDYPLTIQFFESDANGEGKTHLGSGVYTTADFNEGDKVITLGNAKELDIVIGEAVLATATDGSGNTSEFSSESTVETLFYAVTSTGDDGDSNPGDLICDDGTGNCTLRAALEEANTSAGKDSIVFDIPGEGPYTIQPASALPLVHNPVVIDGTTQPSYAGTPIIELDGSNAPNANGIWISTGAENSIVRGLVINRFAEAGIHLGASGGHIIEGNYIGTDVSGTQALGNTIGVWILNNSSNNLIGGKSPGAGNLVSGNNESGIDIREAGSTGNIVQGNFIGTDKTGTTALPNLIAGVRITNSANNNLIGGTAPGAGNLISGNSKEGLLIEGGGTFGNTVQGNFIGTAISGTSPIGNGTVGVYIVDASDNLIGGTEDDAGNLISGNGETGVFIEGRDASNNVVQGNYIGIDVSGTTAIANGEEGVTIMAASDNLIGGTTPEARNVISGNGENGIKIVEGEASGNQVLGNYIGIQADGTSPLGNGRHGVAIGLSAKNNIVGGAGVTPGQCDGSCNKIAFNGQSPGFDGVRILDGTGNAILGNAIFANNALGIDLGVNDVTENDPADPDTGANNLQNFPEVTDVGLIDNGDLVFQFSVDSDPSNAAYPLTIQFFASDPDGEGMRFLGDDVYNIADFNNGAKFANLGNATALEIGFSEFVVATATDSSGNTSEFSPMETVGTITSVAESGESVPKVFVLHQNYPNPFNPETRIQFGLPGASQVILKVYNVLGREVRELVDKHYAAGSHNVQWDGKDNKGLQVPSGIYFYSLQAGDFFAARKMSLIR